MNLKQNHSFLLFVTTLSLVWGHHFSNPLNTYIFSFSVPLMFFMLGFLNKSEQTISVKDRLVGDFKNIMLPYFGLSLILFSCWILIAVVKGSLDLTVTIKQFIGLFYAQGMKDFMDWGLHMWAFPCFFSISILLFFTRKISADSTFTTIGLIFGCMAIGTVLFRYSPVKLPWGIEIALVLLPFYYAGSIAENYIQKSTNLKLNSFIAGMVFIVIGVALFSLNGRVDLKNFHISNPIYFYISAISSTLGLFLLLWNIRLPKIFNCVNEYWIIIFTFHLVMWKPIYYTLSRIVPGLEDKGLLNTLALSLIQIFVISFVAILFNLIWKTINGKKALS